MDRQESTTDIDLRPSEIALIHKALLFYAQYDLEHDDAARAAALADEAFSP